MSKLILILAVAAVALAAWMTRYDVQAGTPGSAYVLDRWTGGLRWVLQNEAEPVTRKVTGGFDYEPAEGSSPK